MIIGIDTGISGGMALLQDGILVECTETPFYWHQLKTKSKTGKFKRRRKLNYHQLHKILWRWYGMGARKIIIEQVHPMQGNGVISAFSQGEAMGAFTAMAAGLGLEIYYVLPTQWKQVHGLIGKDKTYSLYEARRLFGDQWFKLAKDHNKAEAALIGVCGLHDDDNRLHNII